MAQKLKSEGITQPKITFAISDLKEYSNELSESYGLSVNPTEKYIIGLGAKGEKYKFEGEYSVEALEQFARDLLDGKLEQFLKSEPVPDYASSTEKVKTVVAKNFDAVVNDETKDVLIEFYAPWCGKQTFSRFLFSEHYSNINKIFIYIYHRSLQIACAKI